MSIIEPICQTFVVERAGHASVIIAAYDEERSIGRVLTTLLEGAEPGEFEVIVVANGCSDGTADVARSFGAAVRVIERPQPSKHRAMRAGDDIATAPLRIYLDADVEASAASLRALVTALSASQVPLDRTPRPLAVGPTRSIPRAHVARTVSWYYDVWERLPQVKTALFGRGLIAFSAAGNDRIRRLPQLMSDDLAMSDAFDRSERAIVETAVVIVHPPRTVRDLVRRRVRSATGNRQADDAGARRSESKTSGRDLALLVRDHPALAPKVVVFLLVTLVARLLARRAVRRGDYDTWHRDESSRSA